MASNSGFSKTNICACIGPSLKNFEETYSTVLFASRAMTIRIDPKLNEEIYIKVKAPKRTHDRSIKIKI